MARVGLTFGDPTKRLTLRVMLEADGHAIVEAAPEVMICDTPTEAVKAAGGFPVLLLTTAAEVREAVVAMKQGVYGYILVPFVPGEANLMVQRALQSRPLPEATTASPLEDVEMHHIQEVLRQCRGNQAEAARRLGIGRNTLWRKLKKHP